MTTYPPDMDQECVAICDALNSLPGLRTFESCCGHGRYPFRVFFEAKQISSLSPLLEELSTLYPWKVEANWANGNGAVYFLLEGPTGDAAATELLTRRLNEPGCGI